MTWVLARTFQWIVWSSLLLMVPLGLPSHFCSHSNTRQSEFPQRMLQVLHEAFSEQPWQLGCSSWNPCSCCACSKAHCFWFIPLYASEAFTCIQMFLDLWQADAPINSLQIENFIKLKLHCVCVCVVCARQCVGSCACVCPCRNQNKMLAIFLYHAQHCCLETRFLSEPEAPPFSQTGRAVQWAPRVYLSVFTSSPECWS